MTRQVSVGLLRFDDECRSEARVYSGVTPCGPRFLNELEKIAGIVLRLHASFTSTILH